MPLTISPDKIGFNARYDGNFNKPFASQLEFFRQKLNVPSENYDDILKSAHDRAFMVAGAAKADLLADFRVAIDKAIAEGKSLGWFQKEFDSIVAKHGWDYKGGRDWRSRIIYTTNLRASYAAGRYAQLTSPSMLKARPYWKYNHNDTVSHPRPLHISWSGLVLKHDDPWWQTHFAPNGWGCRCYISAVKANEYQGAQPPEDGVYTKTDALGETHVIPKGIDYGWDYAPGAKADTSLRDMVQQKLIRYDPAIARALSKDINKQIIVDTDIAGFVNKAVEKKDLDQNLWLGFVETPEKITQVSGVNVTGYLVTLASKAINHTGNSHGNDSNGQRPPAPNDYARLHEILSNGVITQEDDGFLGDKRIKAVLADGKDTFSAVFEIRQGKRSRQLTLVTFFYQH